MKKRLISMLLVVCMVLTMLPVGAMAAEINSGQTPEAPTATEVRNPFTDVKTGDWFYESVMYVLQNELFKGVSNTKFDPTGTMTRAMYVTVMGRIAEIDPAQYTGSGGFSDVQTGSWYGPYVVWAKEKGITGGVGGDRFAPDGLVTREQMAAMTVRFFESYGIPFPDKVTDTQPKDLDSVASWAKEAVLKLWACGLFQGDNNGNFNPKNNASRAEAAAFCGRVDTRVEQWFIETGVKEDPDKKAEKPDKSSNDSDDDDNGGGGGGDSTNTYAVSFYDGDRLIDTLYAKKGEALGAVPTVEKTSRPDGVFEGWYTDQSLATPFYADNPINDDTSVYAKYTDLPGSELTVTSFAQLDLDPSASFTVVGSGDTSAISLSPKDGSDPVELSITDSNPYTVSAVDGFKPGASYELTLPEGLNFVGASGETLPDTVRTASFTIDKEAVVNLKTNDSVHYVQNGDPSALKAEATVTLADVAEGDLICFYKTTNPQERNYASGNAYMDDPETWFKAGSVSDGTVTLAELGEEDSEKMYNVPDNFLVLGTELPTGEEGALTLADDASTDGDSYRLDIDTYVSVMGTTTNGVTTLTDPNGNTCTLGTDTYVADTLNFATNRISEGDFVSIYISAEGIESEDDIYFGRITDYDPATGTITYVKSSVEEIEAAADLYAKPVLSGEDLVSDEARKEIERTVYDQVAQSGFAEEAGYMLADLATKTDGFRNMDGVQDILLTNENGQPLTDEEIELLNLGGSFELKDGVDLKVEVITSGDQLHFQDKGSVQLAIGIDAKFEVEVEDGGKIIIDLSATFVQEVAIGFTANGELVWKKIFKCIPIPIGVRVGASVDIKSFTGIRVDAQAYTVAEEQKNLWEQLQEAVKDPTKIAGLLPDELGELKKGLETAGDVLDKIDEVKGKLEQVRDNVEKAREYTEDLEMLWGVVGQVDGMPTEEEWEAMGQALGKTNISKDLMDMLDLSTETELDADRYAEGLDDLLTKYSEMLEMETDWVKLVEKEIATAEVNICGLVIYTRADFIVRADMNIAMGASLQYQVGKRYSFWVKVGLFRPSSGSSTMDLVDEEFAFQYYVMGKLGIKMGIEATAGFAIGSTKLARVGLYFEMGPYVKLHGFFIYEYERTRPAGSSRWTSSERMAGALRMEFGLYLIVGVEAVALDYFEASHDFVDAEFPLLTVGEKYFPYAFQYEPVDGEKLRVYDNDNDVNTGVVMRLPNFFRNMRYCDLETGKQGAATYGWNDFNVSFSNRAFSLDKDLNQVKIDVPKGAQYLEAVMTITYKHGKLAFSSNDSQLRIPLVWTKLSGAELQEYYTASISINKTNDPNGEREVVWSKLVHKGEAIQLPSWHTFTALIGAKSGPSDPKFSGVTYNLSNNTVVILEDTDFPCDVTYQTYSITIDGIPDGEGTRSETFSTLYGGTFDFSSLAETGRDGPTEYTKFLRVSTDKTRRINTWKTVSGIRGYAFKDTGSPIDLTQPITDAAAWGFFNEYGTETVTITGTAEYVPDMASVTWVFSGVELDDITETVRKGSSPNYADIQAMVAQKDKMVQSISPALGKVTGSIIYYVTCGDITGDRCTISYQSNGGSAVPSQSFVVGSLIGLLPKPERAGYTFAGWYSDEGLTTPFADNSNMPAHNITLYAKWTANTYAVTFDVNDGDALAEGSGSKGVVYDGTYGTLPVPTKDVNYFLGWFTAADGGEQVKADTKVTITAPQTLYAHWRPLTQIAGTFTCTSKTVTYDKNAHTVTVTGYPQAASGAPELKADSFVISYQKDGTTTTEAVNAGVYDVIITRSADEYYAAFSQTLEKALTINKATRTLEAPTVTISNPTFAGLTVKLAGNAIDDLDSGATITYTLAKEGDTETTAASGSGPATKAVTIGGLARKTTYVVKVKVTGDRNYEDAEASGWSTGSTTAAAPAGSWADHATTVSANANITIRTAAQLAGFMNKVNSTSASNNYSGRTVTLAADIDMSAYRWTPIGTSTSSSKNFQGTFNGNGHTISGLYVEGENYAGLFGKMGGGGTVKNLTIKNSYISGSACIGGIVGYGATVTLTNCKNYADIEGTGSNGAKTGGIAGLVESNPKISGCANYGSVTSAYTPGNYTEGGTGGIVGYNGASKLTLSGCANYGAISHMGGTHIGQLWGNKGASSQVVVTNCTENGSVNDLALAPATLNLLAEETVYTVTLDVNGGDGWTDGAGTLTVTPGRPYGELPTPTKGNSAFLGWFTAAGEGGTLVTADTTVTEENDHTLYAHWEEPVEETVYTVTLDVNGGAPWTDGAGTLTVTPGQPYGELPTPAKADSNFLGWFTAADESGTQVTADTIVTKENDHTLYAHWAAPVQETEPQPEQASLPQEPAQEPQQVEPQPSDDAPKEDAQEPSKTEPQEDPADPQPTV